MMILLIRVFYTNVVFATTGSSLSSLTYSIAYTNIMATKADVEICSCLAHLRCQNGKAITLEFAISLLVRGISLVTWKLGRGSKNKMEFFNGICHEGRGVSRAINIFLQLLLLKNILSGWPSHVKLGKNPKIG